MIIAKTLTALAVVALLLNGCGRSKDLTGTPTPTPSPESPSVNKILPK